MKLNVNYGMALFLMMVSVFGKGFQKNEGQVLRSTKTPPLNVIGLNYNNAESDDNVNSFKDKFAGKIINITNIDAEIESVVPETFRSKTEFEKNLAKYYRHAVDKIKWKDSFEGLLENAKNKKELKDLKKQYKEIQKKIKKTHDKKIKEKIETCYDKKIEPEVGSNKTNWYMNDEEEKDCEWFGQDDSRCKIYGSQSYQGQNGQTACCICGGGTIIINEKNSSKPMARLLQGDIYNWELKKGLTAMSEATSKLGDVLKAVDDFSKVGNVVTKVAKFATVLGGVGAVISIVTIFLPTPDSPELQAIKNGFKEVNQKLDLLGEQISKGFDRIANRQTLLKLDEMVSMTSQAVLVYEIFTSSSQNDDNNVAAIYREKFINSICNADYDKTPEALFKKFYEQSCKTCNNYQNAQKPLEQHLEHMGGNDLTINNGVKNNYMEFRLGISKTILASMTQLMFLYAACPTANGDTQKQKILKAMEISLKEVVNNIKSKSDNMENNWPCAISANDMISPDAKTLFNHFNLKYPGKHWSVAVYNDIGGYNNHKYYYNKNCHNTGNSNYGKYHGVHHGKEIHIQWKNSYSSSRTIVGINPSDEFPKKCTGSRKVCYSPFCCAFGGCYTDQSYGTCGGGANDVFDKATKKQLVVKHGNGLKGYLHKNQFGWDNIQTKYNGGYTVVY